MLLGRQSEGGGPSMSGFGQNIPLDLLMYVDFAALYIFCTVYVYLNVLKSDLLLTLVEMQ